MNVRLKLHLLFTACFIFLTTTPTLQAKSVSLETNEVLQLRALINKDAAAAARFAEVRKAADRALNDKPDPIEKVISEGHLQKDPLKIRSKAAMADRTKIESLAWTWAVTNDMRYLAKAREFFLAWAKVNKADGNAINETQFEPVIVAYDLLRSSFPESERAVVDTWLQSKAKALAKVKGFGGNWPCHRLKIIGLVGLTLGDSSLTKQAIDGFRQQVNKDIQSDGACEDFHVRDAMHYQLYSIQPLLALARAAERHGEHLFDYRGTNGASLHSAVDFVVPYADGTKTHIEFANSKSSFDRERASNGEKEYQHHPWDPKKSIDMFSEAAWFVPEYGKLAAKIAGKPNQTFLNWRMVINAVSPR